MVASRAATHGLVDEQADLPGVGEVEHRGEEGDARDRVVAFLCASTASAAPSSVPPTQKPSALTLSLCAISCATRSAREHALLEIVVPA